LHIRNEEAYNAPGLAFYEIARNMVRAVNDDLVWHLSCGLYLLNLRCWLLLLLLARSLELQQGHSFQHTYCMYMHRMNIMDA
jgi:hypothetical protein